LQTLGTNVIFIVPARTRTGAVREATVATLTMADSEAIGLECPAVLAASPLVFSSGQVIYGNTNWNPKECRGVGQDYLIIRNWQTISGGFFTDRDVSSAAKVCVIGQTLVAKLFQTIDPIDQTIRLK